MSEIHIKLEPLTKEAFTPFGNVIETQGAKHFPINGGTIERYHDLADVEIDDEGCAIISIMECTQTSELPYRIKVIERHPLGSQAFIPMKPIPMIIAVSPPGDTPDLNAIRAFISNGIQGVNYRSGVWHMPLISNIQGQQYLIVDRSGPGHNCDEVVIDDQVVIIHE